MSKGDYTEKGGFEKPPYIFISMAAIGGCVAMFCNCYSFGKHKRPLSKYSGQV